jgi:hypothetical protein
MPFESGTHLAHETLSWYDSGRGFGRPVIDPSKSVAANFLALGAALPDIPVNEVINLFRPVLLETDEEQTVARFAWWLRVLALHWISDDRVRARALKLARDERIKISHRPESH